jgi:hypothetical protein
MCRSSWSLFQNYLIILAGTRSYAELLILFAGGAKATNLIQPYFQQPRQPPPELSWPLWLQRQPEDITPATSLLDDQRLNSPSCSSPRTIAAALLARGCPPLAFRCPLPPTSCSRQASSWADTGHLLSIIAYSGPQHGTAVLAQHLTVYL